jgi:hypothetical protein
MTLNAQTGIRVGRIKRDVFEARQSFLCAFRHFAQRAF